MKKTALWTGLIAMWMMGFGTVGQAQIKLMQAQPFQALGANYCDVYAKSRFASGYGPSDYSAYVYYYSATPQSGTWSRAPMSLQWTSYNPTTKLAYDSYGVWFARIPGSRAQFYLTESGPRQGHSDGDRTTPYRASADGEWGTMGIVGGGVQLQSVQRYSSLKLRPEGLQETWTGLKGYALIQQDPAWSGKSVRVNVNKYTQPGAQYNIQAKYYATVPTGIKNSNVEIWSFQNDYMAKGTPDQLNIVIEYGPGGSIAYYPKKDVGVVPYDFRAPTGTLK